MPVDRRLPCEYVELQLRLAGRVAALGLADLPTAVLRYTNLFRRFGLGHPDDAGSSTAWARYVGTLVGLESIEDRGRWTTSFAANLTTTPVPSGDEIRSGRFSAQVVDGVLRTHFAPAAPERSSPLHPSARARRRGELRTVVARARERYPHIDRVRGVSWLYNSRRYRELFPPEHVATARVVTGATRFQGSSSWGQFLDHRGRVKADLRRSFLAALDDFDGSRPWELFPLPTLMVESPIEVFDQPAESHPTRVS